MIAALDEELAQVAAHKAGAARDEHAVLAAARLGLDQRARVAAVAALCGVFGQRLISLVCTSPQRAAISARSAARHKTRRREARTCIVFALSFSLTRPSFSSDRSHALTTCSVVDA